MPHPKDSELLKVGTFFKWRRTGEFGTIVGYNFQKEDAGFLNYYAHFQGRPNPNAIYAVYHDDLEIQSGTGGFRVVAPKAFFTRLTFWSLAMPHLVLSEVVFLC